MENNQAITYSRNQNDPNNPKKEDSQIQIHQNPPQESKENLQEEKNVAVGIVQVTTLLANQQLTIGELQNLNLNIKITNFLQLLGGYNKLKIICHLEKCVACCRSGRSHQVIGINDQGEENLIMTASQEALQCDTSGYMLVYKTNNVIIGTLGYQLNPTCFCGCICKCSCCECKGGCCEKKGCCADCCQCCQCCTDCCQNGGCCRGGCCTEQGCCCCCEDGCCIGGCCTFCNCCCFEGGCCNDPCCPKGCCPCPDYQKILLDVRFLNTMEEALNMQAGLYVSTLYSPVDICGCFKKNISYKKCGERFGLDNKCFACNSLDLAILDLSNNQQVGNAHQNKSCIGDVESYDVDLPKGAFPLEKLLIISEIFMFVFLKFDDIGSDQMIITKKRKIFPGLNPDYS